MWKILVPYTVVNNVEDLHGEAAQSPFQTCAFPRPRLIAFSVMEMSEEEVPYLALVQQWLRQLPIFLVLLHDHEDAGAHTTA